MFMPTVFPGQTQYKPTWDSIHVLVDQNKTLSTNLRSALSTIQATIDPAIYTNTSASSDYAGNPYKTYSSQVAQLSKMYDNTADWGCMVARNVIDVRTAFSVGNGITVEKRKGFKGSAVKEMAWVEEFMRYNNLDEEMIQEYAKEAEIEGKILFRFLVDTDAMNVRLVHVPWRQYNYTVETPDFDFANYQRAWYIGSGEVNLSFDLLFPWFVYKRFGGNISRVNETPSKTSYVIREMRDLDMAIVDWRKINRLFSVPTPVIYAPDTSTARKIEAELDRINWRIGKMLVLGGLGVSYDLVGWKGDGYTTLKEETQTLVKTISGTTGIPVHFLGYPELLSNRDTAEDLSNLIALSTSKERKTWVGAYEEVFQKAMVIYNTAFKTSFNPMAIDATITETIPNKENPDETVPNSDNPGSNSRRD